MTSDNKGPDDPTIPPLKSGRARMKELAAEAAAERAPLEAALIAGLGREPAALDLVAIETLAVTVVARADCARLAGTDARGTQNLLFRSYGPPACGHHHRPPLPSSPTLLDFFIDDPVPAVAERTG